MGFCLEDFDIINEIGSGAFARVYLVRLKSDGTHYALKCVEKRPMIVQNRMQDIFTERSVLTKTSGCPFLARMHSAFHNATKLYFVCEYYVCGDLSNYLNMREKRRLCVEHARHVAAEVVVALRVLHKSGVMYRDLKPENILLCEEGHVHLSDFGLAKEFTESQHEEFRTSSVVGSPLYVAPEVIQREPYSISVDYWSFGVLLYRMLSGVVPFTGSNSAEVFDKIIRADLKFASTTLWDVTARDLIIRLLNKNPKLRLTGDDVQRHPFFAGVQWELLHTVSPIHFDNRARSISKPASTADLADMEDPLSPMSEDQDIKENNEEMFAGFSYPSRGSLALRGV